ncbi:MAG: hypothetical protein AAF741_09665 [Bacteroidota bacterium]
MDTTFRFLTDDAGEKTDVVVPIKEWEEVYSFYLQHHEIGKSIKRGFEELGQAMRGETKMLTLEEVLDEL